MAALQGLLQGKYRSPVQVKALFIKQYLDIIVESAATRRQRTETLKLAMGSSGQYRFPTLFPDVFGEEDQAPAPQRPAPAETVEAPDDAPLPTDGTAVDYSGVRWKTPSEAREEYDALLAKISAASKGTMNGAQIKIPMHGQWR